MSAEQFLHRWKDALVNPTSTNLADELALLGRYSTPDSTDTWADMPVFEPGELDIPGLNDVYPYPVPDRVIFDMRKAVYVISVTSEVIERQKGTPFRHMVQISAIIGCAVADTEPARGVSRLMRLTEAVRIATEENLGVASSSDTNENTGKVWDVHIPTWDIKAAEEQDGGWVHRSEMVLEAKEYRLVVYASV